LKPILKIVNSNILDCCNENNTNLLKVRANSSNFVHEVLNAEDIELAKRFLNDIVVDEGNTLLVDLAVTSLINQFTDGFQIWLAAKEHQLYD